MNKAEEKDIELQRKEVFANTPTIRLVAPCRLNDGILSLSAEKEEAAIRRFEENDLDMAFFIPASGSGSRMFHFLYDFLNSGEETEEVKRFFKEISKFAFFDAIPINVRSKIGETELTSIAAYLVSRDGMGFGFKPKGLIPFHMVKGERLNPFQEQVVESSLVLGGEGQIQFTIQEEYRNEINVSIESVSHKRDLSTVSYSVQSADTDAYCFLDNGELATDQGHVIRKPAGHGALLDNLNQLKSDYVLIKNIDNIQPVNDSALSDKYWKIIVGYLANFKDALREVIYTRDIEALKKLNEEFHFLSPEEIAQLDQEMFDRIVARPTRVCGMVKNEGKPGGGPFWIADDGKVTKQIVEKAQVSDDPDQQEILEASTHFNPVFMAVSKTDVHDVPLDLDHFKDEGKYIRVHKSHKGQLLHYRELPGLWNGGMHDWNTIFIEVPTEVFTPVKSALDLLEFPHYRP